MAETLEEKIKREVRSERVSMLVIVTIVVMIQGVSIALGGDSLRSFEECLGFAALFGWACWAIIPIYKEYRIRSKETYDLVVEMHETLSVLQARMSQMEDELRGLR